MSFLETSFDRYYQAIEPYTFKSVSVELSREEAQALLDEHSEFVSTFKESSKIQELMNSCEMDLLMEYQDWKSEDTMQQAYQNDESIQIHQRRKILHLIAEKIDRAVTKLPNWEQHGFFCRLATMSPKDACIYRVGFIQRVYEHYKEICKMEKQLHIDFETESNRKLYALYRASTSILRLKRGHEAVQLLIESERARQELVKIASGQYNESTKTNEIILREFNEFDVAMEFRSFVFNRKLTGITQYNPYVYFPHIEKNKQEIHEQISTFLNEQVIGNSVIDIPNFIVDLVITLDGKVKIVEINPLAEFAGTCLFTWEKDRHVITGDGSKVEFRIVTDVNDMAEKEMSSEWKIAFAKLEKIYLNK
ncbi:hypothetical protein C9374_004030 [Naegleria lovaniensis]|uniref:Cell division cycle protein 123 n=1 Tax=Naegleria lovaniensis TaxID=51637 RepID=A0AA88KSN9_NAELO|nr:uncharacterized protein C9374_004030 [Naegleria lovaniensis]KAG2394266.1 hypothetical protein C9374_004030 [Naegleria lovaniensis]